MITTAVIMAAGMGIRFGHYTEEIPKGFVEVSGISMIKRSLDILISCGIQKIIIGTGYKKEAYEALQSEYPQIECCYSPLYADTNSMYTLYNTHEAIGTADFLLLESDLIFERKAIVSLLECPQQEVMLISPVVKFQDQYYIEYNENQILTNCSVRKEDVEVKGELVGIHKISNAFYQKMHADYTSILKEYPRLGYEYELLRMSQNISPVYVLKVDGLKWYEIDDADDLAYAEKNVIQYCK